MCNSLHLMSIWRLCCCEVHYCPPAVFDRCCEVHYCPPAVFDRCCEVHYCPPAVFDRRGICKMRPEPARFGTHFNVSFMLWPLCPLYPFGRRSNNKQAVLTLPVREWLRYRLNSRMSWLQSRSGGGKIERRKILSPPGIEPPISLSSSEALWRYVY